MTDSRGCEHEGTKVETASNRLNGVADPEGATQACVVLPPVDEKAGAHHFMKFNPYCIDGMTEKYIPSTRPGHYWSQMTCVSEYAEVIKSLECS